MPAEKKITVFRAVNDEFQSKATEEHVKKSFLEVVGDVVCTTIETVRDVVTTAIDKAGDWIMDHIPFGRGGGCYITTAICEFQNKPDNCYELSMFRKFRDEWLMKQQNGTELIYHYYKVAPVIVKLIDREIEKDNIYSTLNKHYLLPCLKHIENKEYKKCKAHYIEMVESLCKRYILWG